LLIEADGKDVFIFDPNYEVQFLQKGVIGVGDNGSFR